MKPDEALTKLKLPLNATLLENKELDESEQKLLKEIISKMEKPEVMSTFDELSIERIFRGMITNNKGKHEERVKEAIETYDRIGKYRMEHNILKEVTEGEATLFEEMHSVVGGTDYYGHLIWGEKLGDIAKIVDAVKDPLPIRMKMMETIRLTQTGRRYKQVFVIDLKDVALGSMITKKAIRDMTVGIMSAANAYFPETMWKCFIINAPFIFRSAYAIVSPFIHEVTKQKIKILGAKYLPEMQAAGISLDNVPKQFGGNMPDKSLLSVLNELRAAKDGASAEKGAAPAEKEPPTETEAPADN